MKRAAGADEWRNREEVERHASRRPKSAPALPALVGSDQAQAAAVLNHSCTLPQCDAKKLDLPCARSFMILPNSFSVSCSGLSLSLIMRRSSMATASGISDSPSAQRRA